MCVISLLTPQVSTIQFACNTDAAQCRDLCLDDIRRAFFLVSFLWGFVLRRCSLPFNGIREVLGSGRCGFHRSLDSGVNLGGCLTGLPNAVFSYRLHFRKCLKL